MAQKNVIDVLSELVTIFTAIGTIAAHIEQAYRKHTSSYESRNHPIKITIELHDTSIEVEGLDLETAGASLELAKRYMEKYPSTMPHAINKKSVNIKARVSKRQLRRRK